MDFPLSPPTVQASTLLPSANDGNIPDAAEACSAVKMFGIIGR